MTLDPDGSMVFVATMSGKLHAISAETGDSRWTFYADGGIWTAPAVGATTVFFGTEDGTHFLCHNGVDQSRILIVRQPLIGRTLLCISFP